jgi:hypothetical protein
MGLFKGIGKAIGGIARTVGKVAGAVGKIANFIQKPLDLLMSPIKKLVGGVLDKLPFGIGKFIKPFVDKFLDHGLALLAGGPLGGLGILAKAMPTISKIADLAEKVGSVANKVGQVFPPEGKANLQNIFAFTHAQKLLEAA